VHCGGYVLGRVKIKKISRKKLTELTDEDVRRDGFKNKEELVKVLKSIIPR